MVSEVKSHKFFYGSVCDIYFWIFHVHLKIEFAMLSLSVYLNQLDRLLLVFSFKSLLNFCLILSINDRGVLKSPTIIVNMFIMIHAVKGFGIVNKAEIDVFLELSCFFDDPADVGNLISGYSAFSTTSLNIWKFTVHVLLKPGLKNFEHYFTSVWNECNCEVIWAFFGITFLWDWNANWPFPVCGHCWVLQVGIKIAGRNINNLRYADDTTLMAESEEELKNLLMRVKKMT